MTRLRVTVSTMLGGIAVFAVALAALRTASAAWCIGLFVVEWAALMTATLGVILRRGPARAPWVGALVFGGGLVFASTPNLLLSSTPGYFVESFATIYEQLHPEPTLPRLISTLDIDERERRQEEIGRIQTIRGNHQGRFTAIGMSLLVLAFTALGGFAGRAFAGRGLDGAPAAVGPGGGPSP